MAQLSYGHDARVIDVAGLTIMPGLIDTHTHLTYHGDQPNVWQLEFEESVELNTLKAARNAAHILQTGFTAIGDGGCRGYIGPAIRDGATGSGVDGAAATSFPAASTPTTMSTCTAALTGTDSSNDSTTSARTNHPRPTTITRTLPVSSRLIAQRHSPTADCPRSTG